MDFLERPQDRRGTHRDKIPNPCPESIVRKLPPTSRIGHIPLVEHTTSKVHDDGDDHDDRKDSARSHAARLARLHPSARMLRTNDKVVRALVRIGADKGYGGGGGDGLTVAAEGEGRRLAAGPVVLGDVHGVEGACVGATGATAAASIAGCAAIRGSLGRGGFVFVIVPIGRAGVGGGTLGIRT